MMDIENGRCRPSVARIYFQLVFFFVVFPVLSGAQHIRWSAPISDDSQMKYMKIIGSDENDFFLLRSNYPFRAAGGKKSSKSRKYKISCYSQNMALRWEKVLAAPAADGRILDVRMFNGRLLVSSFATAKDRTMGLALNYMDASGNYTGTTAKPGAFHTVKMDEESRPDLLVSHDESLVAFFYRALSEDENSQVFRAIVCDTALTPLVQKEIKIHVGEKLFSVLDMQLSDSGHLYLLGAQYASGKKVKAPGESVYTLFASLRNEDHVISREMKGGEKFLTDAGLAVDNLNDAAVVSGFYSDKTTYSTAGVFYFAFKPASAEQGAVKTSPFPDSFLKKFTKLKKESGKDLVNYSIDRMLLRRDGGAVLAAESYSTYTNSYYDYYSQMLISHTYYTYGNIITLSVNPDGTLLWNDVLSKEHNSVDDEGYYSSYCSAVYGSKMFYIYNKYIETKTSVMLTSVNSRGDQNTVVLFNQVENIVAVPKAARQIEQDVLLLPAFKENQLCIARINF